MVVFGQGNVKAEWTRVVSDNNNADEEKRLLSETLWSSIGALGLGEKKREIKKDGGVTGILVLAKAI